MKLAITQSLRMIGDLVYFGVRSGRWWMPVVTIMLALAAAVAATVQVVVPSTVYVFF